MNGEANRDGIDNNQSWNCGAEGDTDDLAIRSLRSQQAKNLLTILLCSQGMPMLLMGDEVGRTQKGNSNAYCQDNAGNWFDWDGLKRNGDLHRFVRLLLRFRREHGVFRQERTWSAAKGGATPQLAWHGVRPEQPDWGVDSRSLAFSLFDRERGESIYVASNAFWEPLEFELPVPRAGYSWRLVADTSLDPPHDIVEPGFEPAIEGSRYRMAARSTIVLLSNESLAPDRPPLADSVKRSQCRFSSSACRSH